MDLFDPDYFEKHRLMEAAIMASYKKQQLDSHLGNTQVVAVGQRKESAGTRSSSQPASTSRAAHNEEMVQSKRAPSPTPSTSKAAYAQVVKQGGKAGEHPSSTPHAPPNWAMANLDPEVDKYLQDQQSWLDYYKAEHEAQKLKDAETIHI